MICENFSTKLWWNESEMNTVFIKLDNSSESSHSQSMTLSHDLGSLEWCLLVCIFAIYKIIQISTPGTPQYPIVNTFRIYLLDFWNCLINETVQALVYSFYESAGSC